MTKGAILGGTLLLIGGCSHSPTANEHSLLPPLDISSPAAVEHAADANVVIVSCVVPESIDRPQFVLTQPAGGIRVVPNERWIEPLKLAVPRMIARQLTETLPGVAVWASASAAPAKAAVQVRIEILAWESMQAERASVDLLWHVQGDGASRSGRGRYTAPVGDASYEALIRAHREVLRQGSADIGRTVRSLLRTTGR